MDILDEIRLIQVTKNSYSDDIFDTMAGGFLFDNTFAGGALFNPLIIPSPNMKSILIERSFSQVAQMMQLQNDFVEFGLLAIRTEQTLSDKEIRVIAFTIYSVLNKILSTQISNNDRSGNWSDGVSSSTNGSVSLADVMSAQQTNAFQDIAGQFGYSIAGDLGKTIAQGLAGMMTGKDANFGGHLVNNVVSTFSGLATKSMVGGIAKATGLTSTAGLFAVNMAVGMIVSELVEMALGLDNNFGFGGDIESVGFAGFDARYSPPSSLINELAKMSNDIFGTTYGTFADNYTTDKYGNINSTSDSEGRVTDLSSVSYGIDVTSPTTQTTVETPFSDSYFEGGSESGGGGYGGTDNGGADGMGNGESNHSR